MATRSDQPVILTVGDQRLAQRCALVEWADPVLASELNQLHRTLRSFRSEKGCGRALAAPQIGVLKRVVALQLGAGEVSLINPEITWKNEDFV